MSTDQTRFRILQRRRRLHLTPSRLARLCHLQPDQIRRLDLGTFTPSPSQAWCLAEVLALDPEEISQWALCELVAHPEQLAEHVKDCKPAPRAGMHFYS